MTQIIAVADLIGLLEAIGDLERCKLLNSTVRVFRAMLFDGCELALLNICGMAGFDLIFFSSYWVFFIFTETLIKIIIELDGASLNSEELLICQRRRWVWRVFHVVLLDTQCCPKPRVAFCLTPWWSFPAFLDLMGCRQDLQGFYVALLVWRCVLFLSSLIADILIRMKFMYFGEVLNRSS